LRSLRSHLSTYGFCSILALSVSIAILVLSGCGGSPSKTASVPAAPASPASPNAETMPSIQSLPGWLSCTAKLNGSVCASGRGSAVTSMQENQISPSTDQLAAKFAIAGRTGYSNALWWKSVTLDETATHFTYDLWFYVDHPDVSEALEFDVNQSFGGTRYTWGTECSFKNTHKWDVWDPAGFKWVTTKVPCQPFPANTWHHLVWQFERVNQQVHYVSVTVDDNSSPVDIFRNPQTHWNSDDLNVAFQMDGDFKQDPYNVWLDQVSLTMW
jgi:hypothetical protein